MAQDDTKPTGSPDPQMVLVPFKPGQRTKRIIKWLFSVLLTAVLCFAAGYYHGIRENLHILEQRSDLRSEIGELEKKLQATQEDAAIYRHGSELERQASERVRQENISLQDRVSELEEAVAFYKGIMAPGPDQKGLKIERLELSRTVSKKRFKYKVVMTQVADNGAYVNGNLKMNLLGTKKGSRESIPFDKVAKDWAGGDGAPFNFRFFQDISGEFVVPDEFVPEQIEVIAQSKGRKAVRLEKRFEWKLHEVTSDVGKG